ncbi:MAG: carboxypeptidase M32 [Rickettsiaceae bacterium]|nr:carboxypeptidase M32 [Rickettsiaceae bacterium]
MSDKTKNYINLEKKLEEITHLGNIARIAHWDAATKLKPGSASSKQKEIATLSSVMHKMATSEEMGKLINYSLGEFDHLDDWQRSNLANVKKSYDSQTCISTEIQHEYSIASGECEFIWRDARKNNDFKKLEPYLDRVFDSVRQIAAIQANKLSKPPLDVLIDSYDPECTSHEIKTVFDVLKMELPSIINNITDKQSSEKFIPLKDKISEATQKAINLKIIEKMGFDFDRGRLDKSVHPFCAGSNDDVRLTTRYDENNFLSSLFGVVHEAGHGLYQQNLPANYRNQPVGGPKGMAFHESQSLIMENQAAISLPFMQCLSKILKDDFSLSSPEYSAENLYMIATRVKPSLIRVDADEATYPLHVILRFEIEEAIINGNLRAFDLPDLWNSKMQEYLGIVPDSDANGCMQDLHWPSGAIGYFPSYTNGAIIASMLMKSAKNTYSSIDSEIAMGKFDSLNKYLNDNLRKYGSSKISRDLLQAATGHSTVQPMIFIDYLKNKYL